MSAPDLSAFNFSFDPTLDTWAVSDTPRELDSSEIFLPNVEGRSEFLPPTPTACRLSRSPSAPTIRPMPPAPPSSAPASCFPR